MLIKKDYDLYLNNTYRIHSVAKKVYFPNTIDEILELVSKKKDLNILGSGSNVILSKRNYKKEFLILKENFSNIKIDGNNMLIESGATLEEICTEALKHNLTGMEYFYDIPGTIGGAVVMNAGTKNIMISNIISEVTWFDIILNKIITVQNTNLNWGYRSSEFQDKNRIILNIKLKLQKGNYNDILKTMNEVKENRHEKQPREYPNAGSVFKRPEGHYVGKLIEDLGLKGVSFGDMQISEKHAGFIINKGTGTGEDVIKLVDYIKEKVKDKYNLNLELEQVVL